MKYGNSVAVGDAGDVILLPLLSLWMEIVHAIFEYATNIHTHTTFEKIISHFSIESIGPIVHKQQRNETVFHSGDMLFGLKDAGRST